MVMITSLAISQIFVLDQDQALDFYVDKLGLEVSNDVDLGFMRWLTVRVPGEERDILLERPGAPAYDPATADAVRDMVTKGASGGTLFFNTDDAYATHAELTRQSYGIDFGFRDPFGNHIRIAQRS
jgi:catechol 2,3-dioxygenase-like lactoylglutathione lyase family enzyme